MKKLLLCLLLVGCTTQPQYTFKLPGTDTPETRRQAYKDDYECRREATYQPQTPPTITQNVGVGGSNMTGGFMAGRMARGQQPTLDRNMYVACMRARGYEPAN